VGDFTACGPWRQRVGEAAPAERVRAAHRETRFAGGGVPNFFRTPYGPGWALAGDAGYSRDPVTARGISDAFADAELCADAVHEFLAGTRPYDEAVAEYHQTRDARVGAIYEFTTQLATLEPPPPEMEQLLGAVAGDPVVVVPRLVGSALRRGDVAANRGLNFLGASITAYAEQRSTQVQHEGGTLEPGRLFHNMLSSICGRAAVVRVSTARAGRTSASAPTRPRPAARSDRRHGPEKLRAPPRHDHHVVTCTTSSASQDFGYRSVASAKRSIGWAVRGGRTGGGPLNRRRCTRTRTRLGAMQRKEPTK
jgi:hypothetical protein